jgi:hypothetical protein
LVDLFGVLALTKTQNRTSLDRLIIPQKQPFIQTGNMALLGHAYENKRLEFFLLIEKS